MRVLFEIRIDLAHNPEKVDRCFKMMFRNGIDALRSLGFEGFLFASVLIKNRHFLRKAQIMKKIKHFH